MKKSTLITFATTQVLSILVASSAWAQVSTGESLGVSQVSDSEIPADYSTIELRQIDALDSDGALGHRSQDRQLIDVVQLKGIAGIHPDPTRQHQQWHVVHEGLGDSGQAVGHARSRHQIDHPNGVRGRGNTDGEKARRLLVGDQNRLHGPRVVERVIELDIVRPWDAKGETYALVLEGTNDEF